MGAGLIKDMTCHFNNAKIWIIRGKLSRERINASKYAVLGDPGLLSSKLFKKKQRRHYTLGIVPHYVDNNDARIFMIKKRYKREVLVIDVKRKPSAIFKDINKCDCILSSSLHGIIVADSFNIPNAWIYLSDKVIGKGFKFRDYFSTFGITPPPHYLDGSESLSQLLKYTHKPPKTVTEVKEILDSTFQSFRDYFAFK